MKSEITRVTPAVMTDRRCRTRAAAVRLAISVSTAPVVRYETAHAYRIGHGHVQLVAESGEYSELRDLGKLWIRWAQLETGKALHDVGGGNSVCSSRVVHHVDPRSPGAHGSATASAHHIGSAVAEPQLGGR